MEKQDLQQEFQEKLQKSIVNMSESEKNNKGIKNNQYNYVPAIFNHKFNFIGGYKELKTYLS